MRKVVGFIKTNKCKTGMIAMDILLGEMVSHGIAQNKGVSRRAGSLPVIVANIVTGNYIILLFKVYENGYLIAVGINNAGKGIPCSKGCSLDFKARLRN